MVQAPAKQLHVHAKVSVDGEDRERVEKLCRYLARPPVAQDRLSIEPEGMVRYDFKAAWKDGTRAVRLHPLDFLARLAALVPPPRFHMVRYQGCFAARSKVRAEVVRGGSRSKEPVQLELLSEREDKADPGAAKHQQSRSARSSRHPWAYLLKRVFSVDVETCSRCGGRMKLVEIANDQHDIARVLALHGLGPDPPDQADPIPVGQMPLVFA